MDRNRDMLVIPRFPGHCSQDGPNRMANLLLVVDEFQAVLRLLFNLSELSSQKPRNFVGRAVIYASYGQKQRQRCVSIKEKHALRKMARQELLIRHHRLCDQTTSQLGKKILVPHRSVHMLNRKVMISMAITTT